MRPLSDHIEEFIKSLLGEDQEQVDVQRNELATYFRCAPSQITYVLSTRFTPDHGYIIESRRGGGGFIRIVRLQSTSADQLVYLLQQRIGEQISAQDAAAILSQLAERDILTDREAAIMQAATSAQAINSPVALKDALRANILRTMLLQVARQPRGGES
ncbi:MAG: CtsR family transcriptional regulator [Clostridia bacterium]